MDIVISRRVFAVLIVVVVAAISALLLTPTGNVSYADKDKAKFACELLCKGAVQQGRDLSQGPCLSTELGDTWELADWVCDIAHDPREPVDNRPENQCPEYGETANHFVEFTPDCRLIASV